MNLVYAAPSMPLPFLTVLAYLDPGTGSMLFAALLGILATLFFVIKGCYYRVKRFVFGLFGVTAAATKQHGIVFYSEGKHYWNTFKPVIEALDHMGRCCTYLTSDADDTGLAYVSQNVETKYIGKGNRAYAYLNLLEADVCVLTTPGLDVLHIRRSRGVKHYVHLIHAPTDVAMYKLYSFDYYDSILTSGPHQKRSIRELERLRGTRPKELYDTGCCYLDNYVRQETHAPRKQENGLTVLVAPTWGKNGLLTNYGIQLLKPLAAAGYNVIIRPHPQSYVSEPELLRSLQSSMASYTNLRWDDAADGFSSMAVADVMLSDLSGVIFDFAFLFEKPVLTLQYELNKSGMEAFDIPWEPWELTALETIGERVDTSELAALPTRLQEIAGSDERRKAIRQLRDSSVYNFGHGGAVAARQIAGIVDRLAKGDL